MTNENAELCDLCHSTRNAGDCYALAAKDDGSGLRAIVSFNPFDPTSEMELFVCKRCAEVIVTTHFNETGQTTLTALPQSEEPGKKV